MGAPLSRAAAAASHTSHAPPPSRASVHRPSAGHVQRPSPRAAPSPRSAARHSAPLPQRPIAVPARGYATRKSWSPSASIIEHGTHALEAGSSNLVKTACSDIVDKWKEAADRSQLYNMMPWRKIEGKSIGNRKDFRTFLTTKVFSNFADHLSPKWQNVFRKQLKDLSFDDAYAIYTKLCDVSTEYIMLADDKLRLEKKIETIQQKQKEHNSKKLQDELLEAAFYLFENEDKITALNTKMSDIAADCIVKTSIAHTKEMFKLAATPQAMGKKQAKLEALAGFSSAELRKLTDLQTAHTVNMEQLALINKDLHPEMYAQQEEECKKSMQALLDIIQIQPKEMAQIAEKFERKYRSRAGETIDPDHYISTEHKYLSVAKASCLSHLLLVLVTAAVSWLILDQLETARQNVEREFNSFIDKSTRIQHDTIYAISSIRSNTTIEPDGEFDLLLNEFEMLNNELKTSIDEFQKVSKEQLTVKESVKNIYKINKYKTAEEYLLHSNDRLTKRGNHVADLTKQIIEKRQEVQKAQTKIKVAEKLADCEKDLNAILASNKIDPSNHKVIYFKDTLAKLKRFTKFTDKFISRVESFTNEIHSWKKRHTSLIKERS